MMTAMVTARWAEVMREPPIGLKVIVDDQVGEDRGQLRSLSILTDLGLSQATFALGWHKDFRPVPFVHHTLKPERAANMLQRHGHLVQVVSQKIINRGLYELTYELVRLGLQEEHPPLVVLVVDTGNFQLPGAPDGKSIFENWGLLRRGVLPMPYDTLYRRYMSDFKSPLEQVLTRNVYFHRLAAELAAAGWRRFDRLADLFPVWEASYPLTPLVRLLLEHFMADTDRCQHVKDFGTLSIMDEMRGWLEHGEAGAVAGTIYKAMERCDFDWHVLLARKGAMNA